MKFIEFDDALFNAKYIGKVVKLKGTNAYQGKFSITLVLDGFENKTEWFDTEEERNKRFNEIKNMLI